MWISSLEGEEWTSSGDPVESIDGLLSGIDVEPVELQHFSKDVWTRKVLKNASNRR